MDKRDCIYPDCILKDACEHSCPFWHDKQRERIFADLSRLVGFDVTDDDARPSPNKSRLSGD